MVKNSREARACDPNVGNRQPMQLLLEKSGYSLSGFIDNLDPGDPELVYFKRLRD